MGFKQRSKVKSSSFLQNFLPTMLSPNLDLWPSTPQMTQDWGTVGGSHFCSDVVVSAGCQGQWRSGTYKPRMKKQLWAILLTKNNPIFIHFGGIETFLNVHYDRRLYNWFLYSKLQTFSTIVSVLNFVPNSMVDIIRSWNNVDSTFPDTVAKFQYWTTLALFSGTLTLSGTFISKLVPSPRCIDEFRKSSLQVL